MAYLYIGPPEIRERAKDQPAGTVIADLDALREWLEQSAPHGGTCTYVIGTDGLLRLADRHAEHIACSGGQPVLSAGELTIVRDGAAIEIESITNLSTGFCPEPESWPAVAAAVARLGIPVPSEWAVAYQFRRCDGCSQRNVIKDGWMFCDVCDAPLSAVWNFGRE